MLHTETILLVEDEALMRRTVSRALRKSGYQVVEAETIADAMRLAPACPKGQTLFVMDALLPGAVGIDLSADLKRIHPAAHVLFLSGYEADVVNAEELEKKGDSVLSRPVTADGILRRVRQILDGSLVPQPKLHTTVTAGHKLL